MLIAEGNFIPSPSDRHRIVLAWPSFPRKRESRCLRIAIGHDEVSWRFDTRHPSPGLGITLTSLPSEPKILRRGYESLPMGNKGSMPWHVIL